jgi:diacylglycerol kinase family enzyme
MQIGVITNPNSRKNRNRPDRAERLQRIVGSLGEVHETSSVESIKPVLRDFLRKQARYWVADGGDGALHWMLRMGMEVLQEDEFVDQSVTLPMTLPTKGGTIDFVANNVGIEGDAEGILAMLRRGVEGGTIIEETEVDSMVIDGEQLVDGTLVPFRTYGFASAAGGIGQRFYSKYYEHADPNPRTIVKVVANTVASAAIPMGPGRAYARAMFQPTSCKVTLDGMRLPGTSAPIALTPLARFAKIGNLNTFAKEVFAPTKCKVTLDGMVLPGTTFTGVHVASMSINLGNVLRFFGKADQPGLMNAIVGTPSPWSIIRNIPRMARGEEMKGRNILDRPCREMVLEASGDELLEPVIDGEYYRNVKKVSFHVGPRVRIPKVVAPKAA